MRSPSLGPLLLFAGLVLLAIRLPADAAVTVAGLARVDISPTKPVPLMGYAARARLPMTAEIAQPIHARALAIGEGPETALLVTIDNCILPRELAREARRQLVANTGIRPERIAITVTHTHCAPCLRGAAPNIFAGDMSPEMLAAIDEYSTFLLGRLNEGAAAALADRKPALLSWGKGSVAFAKNRRTPQGPVDHELPLLRITAEDGTLRGVWVSYACHCTTLDGKLNAVHGDWAGMAAQAIERDYPGAVSLVSIGCGADANPFPRGTLELVTEHGEELAKEATRLLASDLTRLDAPLECRMEEIQLPFQRHFTQEELQQRATQPTIVGYHARKWLARLQAGSAPPQTLPYVVQSWCFGDKLAIVFLAGEVVVDYSLRLKREKDAARLWVNGYSNEVPCYIPSVRILNEGGYEAETSLWYYDQPQRLSPQIEELIIDAANLVIPASFRTKGSVGSAEAR